MWEKTNDAQLQTRQIHRILVLLISKMYFLGKKIGVRINAVECHVILMQ